jgi:TonB family protein
MRLRLLAAAAILTGSLFGADPELVGLAMPDTQVMAGVNVEQVKLSPLGQFLLAQIAQNSEGGLQELTKTTGFDPRRDLREILVCTNGLPANGPTLLLARGAFDVPKILAAAVADGGKSETYKGVPIVIRAARGSLALPDSTLAMVGDVADLHAAIDRKTAPTAIGSALAVQVNQLSTSEDAWFVSMVPPSQLQGQAAANNGGAGPNPLAIYSKVQQASGGVKFGANVVVSLQAVSDTAQDAAMLATVLKAMGIGLSGNSQGDLGVAAALLKGLNVTADGKITTVSLTVPEQQLEQMMASHIEESHHANPPQSKMEPAPQPEVNAAGGPVPQRIRVGSAVQKAKLIEHPEPVCPAPALQARISGVMHLNVIIGKDGTVQNVSLANGHPLLAGPAMEAVKQWTYQPTLLNGQAMEVATQVEVNFDCQQ